MTPITLLLSYPSPVLSRNSRAHHMAKWRAGRAAKDEGFWAAKEILPRGFQHDGSRLSFKITAYPPDNRKRDDDNLSFKEYRDGIAKAMGIDDNLFVQSLTFGEPVPGGKSTIIITPIDTAADRLAA